MRLKHLLYLLLYLSSVIAPLQAAERASATPRGDWSHNWPTDWRGRKLSEVLDELRMAGMPLLYSSQIINDTLIIAHDPGGALTVPRLQSVLTELGLELQTLATPPTTETDHEMNREVSYAVVRKRSSSDAVTQHASSNTLEEVTVFASRYNLSRSEAGQSIAVPHASLEKTAGIEQDVLRSVQYLPGSSGNGLSALTHVRGGYTDENLIRFDGVELYDPVHLKNFQGLFGLLDPDWAESVNFYTGAYPVNFGNHNSAVIDIAARNVERTELTLGASLLYTRLFSAGNYAQNSGNWLVGYRRSNLADVLKHLEKNLGEPEFEDLLLRHSYRLGSGTLRMGLLRLNDDLELQTTRRDEIASSHNHDTYLWAGWQDAWSADGDYHVQVSRTELSNRRRADVQHAQINSGDLDDARSARLLTLDGDAQWRMNEQTQWLWGAHLNQTHARYAYRQDALFLPPLTTTFDKPGNEQRNYAQQFSAADYATYLSLNQAQGAWRSELGLRYDLFPLVAHGAQFSPRLNVQYTLSPRSVLHASAGHYVQAQMPHQLDSTAATPQLYAPQRMRQYIVGWTDALSPSMQLRVEAYQKRGERLSPHSENLLSVITLASELAIDRVSIDASRSRAQGVELSLSSSPPTGLGWWANYSWSRVQDWFNNQYVPRTWDQPHALTAGGNWGNHRWLLSGSATWHTGWRYTPVTISSAGDSASVGARNSQHFATFASLELRAQYTVPVQSAALQLFVELRNALDHNNECCRELSIAVNNGMTRISVRNDDSLSLIPIAGFNLKF